MGKITLMVEGTTVGTVANGGGITTAVEVSDTDSARVLTAMAGVYQDQFRDPLPEGERGRGALHTPSIEEIVRAWFTDIVETALRLTVEIEKQQATTTIARTIT